jgi:hypothetical protein
MNGKQKATQLSDISRFAAPKPLDESTWHLWVNTEEARESHVVRRLIEQLRQAHEQADPVKILFAGHSGSGKSTELFRVKREIKNLYHVVIKRIGDRYSLPTIDYRQLLFFCASVFVEVGMEQNAVIAGRDEAKQVLDWFDEISREEVESGGQQIAIEAGAKVGFFTAFFAKFSGKIYSGGETKETAVKYIESRLDQLRLNMRILVQAIEKKLDGRKLLLILEDLDKIEDRDQSTKLFFEHRLQLLDIPCPVIFTFPIGLWYEQDASVQSYPIRHLLPMIPVSPPPASDSEEASARRKVEIGRNTLRHLIFQRIDESANLIMPEALEYLTSFSGGILRDFLYILREAAIEATIKNHTHIDLDDVKTVSRLLRSEYANRISPPQRPFGETTITLEDINQTLGNVTDWPKRTADRPAAFRMLLQSLCILEYNGEQWFNLHPAVREYLEIRNAERETRKAKKEKTARPRKR